MTIHHRESTTTAEKTWSLLGTTLTLKDILQYMVLLVAAVFFVSNMNNRIDNLTQSVERLNTNFLRKDAVDESQNQRLNILDTGMALVNQKLQISPTE